MGKIRKNCAINDTSMNFVHIIGNVFRKIFGYRDITDSSFDKKSNGLLFFIHPLIQNLNQRVR